MNNLKTSVVLSTYNGEKYIEEQLRSIFEQTVKPDEIIVCDDCSVDHTKEIVKKCLNGCGITNIFIEHEQNRGVVKSFEEAIKKAQGDIVFLCDQDDVWCPNKIQTYLKYFLRKPNCKLVFADAYITDEKLHVKKKSLWDSLNLRFNNCSSNEQIVDEMLRRNVFTGMSMAFRKNIINEAEDFPDNMLHDEYIGWLALSSGYVVPIEKKLVLYRQHSNNVVGISRTKKFTDLHTMKKMVLGSSKRTFRKFNKIYFLFEDLDIKRKIMCAIMFYNWRASLKGKKFKEGIKEFIRHCLLGDYQKFTSKTEKAKIKDFICIIL